MKTRNAVKKKSPGNEVAPNIYSAKQACAHSNSNFSENQYDKKRKILHTVSILLRSLFKKVDFRVQFPFKKELKLIF